MENLENSELISQDGLIDPSQLLKSLDNKKANQVKEIKSIGDGLMERNTTKVVTNDGRQLLF